MCPPAFASYGDTVPRDRGGRDGDGQSGKRRKEDLKEMVGKGRAPGSPSLGANVSTIPANLNFGISDERVYLCYRRSREGNPITGIIPLQPTHGEAVPEGYTVLERTPRNHVADISFGAGPPLFLAFRQRLANLETLRPLPLVRSVYYSNLEKDGGRTGSDNGNSASKSRKKKRLSVYYCTGGTVVSSKVGKYHIMDRSTHPLLSPSSVTNRLSLIEQSRRQRSSTASEVGPGVAGGKDVNESPGGDSLESGSLRAPDTSENSLGYGEAELTTGQVDGHSSTSQKVTSPGLMRRHRGGNKDDEGGKNNPFSFPTHSGSAMKALSLIDSTFPESLLEAVSESGPFQSSIVENASMISTSSKSQLPEDSNISSMVGTLTASPSTTQDFQSFDSFDSVGGKFVESNSSPYNVRELDSTATHQKTNRKSFAENGHHSHHRNKKSYKRRRSIFSHSDATLQSCFDTMRFIPAIELDEGCYNKCEVEGAVSLLQTRVAVLSPILTACYMHHGGSALVAVEGLRDLINGTDFFRPDLLSNCAHVTDNDDDRGKRLNGSGCSGSSTHLTLLDLSVQVVCDVATSTSRETHFGPCVDFVSDALRYADGNLNTRTIGYVLRFYLFVFYFGASVPTGGSWPNCIKPPIQAAATGTPLLRHSSNTDPVIADEMIDVALLHEEEQSFPRNGRAYLPGGAPQAAALFLKEFISLLLGRMSQMTVKEQGDAPVVSSSASSMGGSDDKNTIRQFMNSILTTVIDGAMHRVDIANHTQLALHQIHRSGGSELFWHDMMASCGVGLFGQERKTSKEVRFRYIITFSLLASLVKVMSGKVRRVAQPTNLVRRDVASKLLSLELLLHFLKEWRLVARGSYETGSLQQKQSSSSASPSVTTMAYAIRRIVVPCLLSNTGSGLENGRVFRRMLRIVSELWISPYYRRHLKMELGVLIEHFVLKILRLGPQVLPPQRLSDLGGGLSRVGGRYSNKGNLSSSLEEYTSSLLSQQIDVLTEVRRWFSSEPTDILELFLNYDMADHLDAGNEGLAGVSRWKIVHQLCEGLCTLAEQCGDIISEQTRAARAVSSLSRTGDVIQPGNGRGDANVAEMTHVREGARMLQEKSFQAIAEIMKSFMECAAAASGNSYHRLLSHPPPISLSPISSERQRSRKKKEDIDDISFTSNVSKDSKDKYSSGDKKDGDEGNVATMSPRRRHLPSIVSSSPKRTANSEDGGIVEYWQTSIAERRRVTSVSVGHGDGRGKVSHMERMASPDIHIRVVSGTTKSSLVKKAEGSNSFRSSSLREDIDAVKVNIADSRIKVGVMSPPSCIDTTAETTIHESAVKSSQYNQKMEENLSVAFEIVKSKSLKKGIEYLVACNLLTPSPRDIASFLRIHQAKLDPEDLGEYLGEGGRDGADVEYWNLIRFNYVRAISFVGMNVEQG